MLFNVGNIDKNDSGEDSLVAKIFCGYIFSPFVSENSHQDYRLARTFLKYFLDPGLVDKLDFSTAEMCVKPKYNWFGAGSSDSARKMPDLLLLFPQRLVAAFECKYTRPFDIKEGAKITRYLAGLERFQENDKYVVLLITDCRLRQHLQSANGGYDALRQCVDELGDRFRFNTWNCVYNSVELMDGIAPDTKSALLRFMEQKQNAMTNSIDGKYKRDFVKLIHEEGGQIPAYGWADWRSWVLNPQQAAFAQSGSSARTILKTTGHSTFEDYVAKCSPSHAIVQQELRRHLLSLAPRVRLLYGPKTMTVRSTLGLLMRATNKLNSREELLEVHPELQIALDKNGLTAGMNGRFQIPTASTDLFAASLVTAITSIVAI